MKTLVLLIMIAGAVGLFVLTPPSSVSPSLPRVATTSPPSKPVGEKQVPPPKVSNFVLSHAKPGRDMEEFQRTLEANVAKEKHLTVHGRVQQHWNSGHLLVSAMILNPESHSGTRKLIALFGYPNADQIADGETIDCFASQLETMSYPTVDGGGRTIFEYIYVPANGRRLPKFEQSLY